MPIKLKFIKSLGLAFAPWLFVAPASAQDSDGLAATAIVQLTNPNQILG